MDTHSENRRKRLKFQAWHRGFKEIDLILGPFADERVGQMDDAELDQFEALLAVPDQDLYDWICERSQPPERLRNRVYEQIFDFSRRPRGT
ncbi:MAG: succinate dehydrogenase assembly factor 2 [Alphaproteobacteria bacterium]|nr:succinate dehydrogenase assembly factor 2 [Alphaproteobacteria bacterium]